MTRRIGMLMRFTWIAGIAALVAATSVGCGRRDDRAGGGSREVVVYTALDRGFSEPLLDAFTKKTGIVVRAVYDAESTKTIGLVSRIREERNRPRCDVFWNNEIVNTIRLKSEGLLAPSHPAEAANYDDAWKDRDGTWYGFAARARILIVNTNLARDEGFPASIHDLADPRYKGQIGIAKPLFGTTASHIACLFATIGPEPTTAWLDAIKQNGIQIHDGNKGAAMAVSAGACAFALTDTDDAIGEIEAGRPVRIVYPDSDAKGIGTLFLPNTLSVVAGAPHPAEAVELINYLLTADVEQALAAGPSAQIPLRRGAQPTDRVRAPGEAKAMIVDFEKAAKAFDAARDVIEKRFLQ